MGLCVAPAAGSAADLLPSVVFLGPFERGGGVIGRDVDGANFLTEKKPGKQHLGLHKNIEAGI